jgi:hypothetical protein
MLVSSTTLGSEAYEYGDQGGPAGVRRISSYFGTHGEGDRSGPQGFLVETEPNHVIDPHFHEVDQFQIVVNGGGTFGKHDAPPVSVHYANAFTPYGPIRARADGIAFFTLRVNPAVGARYMPGSRNLLEPRPRRAIMADTTLRPGAPPHRGAPLVQDEVEVADDGLIVRTYRLEPGDAADGPSPRSGGGQYHVVINGSCVSAGDAYLSNSLGWVAPDSDVPRFTAGSQGLDLVLVQFPLGAA